MIEPYRMVVVNIISLLVLLSSIIFFNKLFPKRKVNLLLLIILISVLPLMSLVRTGTYESGDLTLHSVFLRSFYENLHEGNLIPQWAGGLCGGKGCPVFLFEYITPFYFGSIIHFLGFSYINSIKISLAFSFILSGLGMYYMVKDQFKEKSAFAASLFYLFAPFHLQEMHFRVGIGMMFAFSFVPFLFLFSKKLVESLEFKYLFLSTLILFLLITSHSTITIFTLPLLTGYICIIILNSKKRKIFSLMLLLYSFSLPFGLSSFYWLPALLENKYTWYLKDLTISDFKPIQEYLFSPIMYGFLFQGHNGELRLIIGYVHLFIVVLALLLLFKGKSRLKEKRLVIFFLLSFFIFFFLLLKVSIPIWNNIPFLKSSVLPWRALMPIAFITSLIAALVVKRIQNKKIVVVILLVVIISTILNWGNRKMVPEDTNAYNTHWSLYTEYYEEDDSLHRQNYVENIAKAPLLVLSRPKQPMDIINGKGMLKQLYRSSVNHSYILKAETDLHLKENTFYFPGWKVFTNYKEIPINYKDPKNLGLITFNLKPGLYKIDVLFTDTPIRKLGKTISALSLGFLGLTWGYFLLHKRI